MEKYTNALAKESSPYLLQHAHNPVDWVPWSPDVFERAEKENKLVLISVGYSACHWCHVMEHESFEDEEVAAIMNKHFINVTCCGWLGTRQIIVNTRICKVSFNTSS